MLSVMIRGAAVICCLASSAMAERQPTRVDSSQLAHTAIKDVLLGERVQIQRFELPSGEVELELSRVDVLREDAELVVGSVSGFATLDRPEVVILSGKVAGVDDSTAYLAISPYGVNGFVDLHGELVSISTGPYAQDKELQTALEAARVIDVIDPEAAPAVCGYTDGDTALEPSGPMDELVALNARGGSAECRIAGIAIDTDWNYTNRLFSGNTNAAAAYAVSLMGAVSEIYERDLGVRLEIPFLRVWSDNSDPYVNTLDPLDQVRSEWNANMTHVDRTVVHLLTGRTNTSYGGIAYVSALCGDGFDYGVSAHLTGSFPYPLVDHNSGNWDLVVVSHELGHNFGTSHTHNYSPVIDGCGNGDCAGAFGGTIMSYCHSCSGGMNNLVLEFHPRVRDVVIGYMDTVNCDLEGEAIEAMPDSASGIVDSQILIDALGNDESASCNAILIDSFDATTAEGGMVALLAGQGPGGRDLFRYTPPAGYDGYDSFSYTITDSATTRTTGVAIDIQPLRASVERNNPIEGLGVSYYALSSPSVLPDFDQLKPFATDVADAVGFTSTEGEFMNSGLSDNIGAVLEGYVMVLFDGIYTFSTESDDGSRLLIGDQLVVSNDGLHGMIKAGGSIALEAGWHPIRVEVFEAGGGAGLIARIAGAGFGETTLTGSVLSHESGIVCSPDFTGDGVLDIFDVLGFVEAFNASDPSADFTSDGVFDIFDVLGFVAEFNAGCP